MLKHAHREFPSDLFVVLETVGAKVTISKAIPANLFFRVYHFVDIFYISSGK